jgi:hypothetical protein
MEILEEEWATRFEVCGITPIFETKNDQFSLDWQNENFYAKIVFNIEQDQVNIFHLITEKFEDNLIENWLVHSFAKLAQDYNIKSFYIPEASEDIKHITSKIGFVESDAESSLQCDFSRIWEYHLWKTEQGDMPNWYSD